jgi:hypothetical protein
MRIDISITVKYFKQPKTPASFNPRKYSTANWATFSLLFSPKDLYPITDYRDYYVSARGAKLYVIPTDFRSRPICFPT